MIKLDLRSVAVAAAAAWLAACPAARANEAAAGLAHEERTARYLDQVRDRPVPLAMFLRRMPKGGDLHDHLTGAVYAESFIDWAARDGLCLKLAELTLVPPPCDRDHSTPSVADVQGDPKIYHDMVDAFSMRNFAPSSSRSGHDQFFSSFARFEAVVPAREADMIAEVADRAAADQLSYVELMWSPGMNQARALASHAEWSEDFDAASAAFAPGLAAVAAQVRAHVDATEAKVNAILRCGTSQAHPGCAVTVRFIAQVIRTRPPAQVFAQSQLAFELAHEDPRFVGVNLVAPEDDPTTLRDYDKQMRLLAYLGRRYPDAPLTLHAGEVVLGLVPPADLRSHIRQAVEVAGARRIGHGVDLKYEDDAAQLLREMAERKVLVEINLTSNDVILGVRGKDHPFTAYLAAGVPLALSTDDAGVSRIDLTHEFERAVTAYGLSYAQLKTLARNSLEFSFAGGESLWAKTAPYEVTSACSNVEPGAAEPPAPCRALLERSIRARLQWRLEAAFADFEATPWPAGD